METNSRTVYNFEVITCTAAGCADVESGNWTVEEVAGGVDRKNKVALAGVRKVSKVAGAWVGSVGVFNWSVTAKSGSGVSSCKGVTGFGIWAEVEVAEATDPWMRYTLR